MENRRSHAQFNPRFDPFNPQPGEIPHDPAANEAFNNIDWNDPSSFFKAIGAGTPGGLPMPEMITANQVRNEAQKRCSKILEDWTLLNGILQRHELTIQKRWAKKVKEQRRKILLAAWPNMPINHRPDFEVFRKEPLQQREAGTRYRKEYMWPDINQEDLLKPNILPLLLNARGRHTPDAFAMFDCEMMHLGKVSKALVPGFLNLHTLMLTPKAYGKLISWDEDQTAFEAMLNGTGMHPGEGLHILERQQELLSFLVACCKEMLQDIEKNALLSDVYPIQAEPSIVSHETPVCNYLAVMASEAPYRAPAKLNSSRIVSLLSAKLAAAKDHIWSLREDPDYFAVRMADHQEHRQEVIKDSNGNAHPLFKHRRQDIIWARVIANELVTSYMNLESWSELHSQALRLAELEAKYASTLSVENPLPEELLQALLRFQHYLDQTVKGPLNQLKTSFVASPNMRPFFLREKTEIITSTKIHIQQKPNLKADNVRHQLLWLMETLWENGQTLFFARLPNVVDELERLLRSETQALGLVSSFIADILGDLAVLAECSRQIAMFQPWATGFEHAKADRQSEIEGDFATVSQDWGLVMKVCEDFPGVEMARLGDPSDRKFNYPVDKRRNEVNVNAMRLAERNLDAFWSEFDKKLEKHAPKSRKTAIQRLLEEARTIPRTPEWVQPPPTNEGEAKQNDTSALEMSLTELYLSREFRTERTPNRTHLATFKFKEKTRGLTHVPPESQRETSHAPETEIDKAPLTFAVDRRAHKVFKTLFYTPSVTGTPGEIAWNDFLHAMVSTGFRPEKLYGSVWQFHPTKLDVERSIQFHEPHPSGKIPYKRARNHGRRLDRAYGWHSDIFVLKEKDTIS